jgi:hypothetical protein
MRGEVTVRSGDDGFHERSVAYDRAMDDGTRDDRLPRWGFAFPGRIRDELTALALAGTKTTTTGLLVELELDGEAGPAPADPPVRLD